MKRRSPAHSGRFGASWNGFEGDAVGGFRILDEGKIAAPWSGFQRKAQKPPTSEIRKALEMKAACHASKADKLAEAGLGETFGAEEPPERAEAEEPNSPKYSGTAKSRTSRIENGTAIPSVAALGFRAESVKAV